jgi:alpha-L-fucosidase
LTDDGAVLKGKVMDYKPALAKRARFYYRPYAGQVETLYAAPWVKTAWVNINADGTFSTPLKGLKKGSRFEYKAVAEQQKVAVEGETSVVSL